MVDLVLARNRRRRRGRGILGGWDHDDPGTAVTFPATQGLPDPLDLVLLCFSESPASLPPALTTLADADPTVVFVLPDS